MLKSMFTRRWASSLRADSGCSATSAWISGQFWFSLGIAVRRRRAAIPRLSRNRSRPSRYRRNPPKSETHNTKSQLAFSSCRLCRHDFYGIKRAGYLKAVWPESVGATKWPSNWSAGLTGTAKLFGPHRSELVLKPSLVEHLPKIYPTNSDQPAFKYPDAGIPGIPGVIGKPSVPDVSGNRPCRDPGHAGTPAIRWHTGPR